MAGVDRFDTAAKIARATFTTATTVIVANGDRVIDAQAASYLAGINNAPILLTRTDSVPTQTLDAIKALGATTAIVLGDNTSVSATARAQMTGAGLTVQSIAGDNRFDTAADIYNTPATKAKTVFLARGDYGTGQVSPDALAAGPISFKSGIPVLLTNAGDLPAETRAALVAGGVTKVVYLGNGITDAVKNAVAAAVPGVTQETIAGSDRSVTAQLLANSTYGTAVFNKTSASIANGERVDALAAGPWAGTKGTPILLTLGTNALGAGTTGYLDANKATLTSATVFGDVNSVPAAFLTQAATAGGGGPVASNQTLAITPVEAVALPFADETSATATSDDRVYTVSGLNNASTYRVTLVNSANVTVGANGAVTFVQDGSSGLAAAGSLAADITVVNGVPTGADTSSAGAAATTAPADIQSVGAITPSGGVISFRVDGQADESVTPVIYVDGGANTRLEIGATGAPSEAFGVGGTINFQPAEATSGSGTPGSITEVDKANSQLVAGSSLYKFDANDNYFIGAANSEANRVTQAAFLAELSVGDSLLAGVYQRETSLQSTFALSDLTPAAPTGVTGTASPTGAVVTVPTGNFTAGATLKVYVGPNDNDAYSTTTDTLRATATVDADTTLAGFQIPVTGLTESTGYDVFVTQTVSGEESDPSTRVDLTTTSSTIATAPVSLANTHGDNDLNGLLNSGDSLTVTFNEAVTAAAGAAVTITDNDGTVGTVTSGSGATFTVSGTNNNVLTIALTANPTGGGGTAAGVNLLGGDDNITAATGVTDRGATALAWAPANTQGVAGAPIGESTVPGSTVVLPVALAAPTATAGSAAITGTAAIPFASISVTVTGGPGAGTYTTTASSTGTWSVTAAGNLAGGNTAIATQTVSGVGTSANSATATA